MTQEQLEFIWQRAEWNGDQDELRSLFPDVDWEAFEQARRTRHEAEWAARPHTEQTLTQSQVDAILKDVWEDYLAECINARSPLMDFFKK